MQILICPECRSKVISLGEPDDDHTCDHCEHTFQHKEDDEEEITVSADVTIKCTCYCPHCRKNNDVLQEVAECLDSSFYAEDIQVEIICKHCNEMFYIDRVSQ